MTNKHNNVELGANITNHAKGKQSKNTVVISVRISLEEFARLEVLATKTGNSISEIAREALANYTPREEGITAMVVGFGNVSLKVGCTDTSSGSASDVGEIRELIEIG